MRKLFGCILVKETGAGIPNLVVTAYDSERQGVQSASHEERGDLALDSLGKRIGSVLTDKDGKFLLSSEDLEFQGNEARPDLSIAVFAPEDVQAVNRPFARPPQERLLYLSTVPRTDAGAEEAFVIRLLQAQLDSFRIATAAGSASESASNHFANAIEGSWLFRDNLRERLQPRLQKEHDRLSEIKALAHEKVRTLSAIPLQLRDDAVRNNKFLIKDRNDLTKNLKQVQDQAIGDGLNRFQKAKPELRLTVTTRDLQDLGLSADENGISGQLDPDKLSAKVRSLINGVDLIRVRGLNNPPPEDLERKYLRSGLLQSGDGNSNLVG